MNSLILLGTLATLLVTSNSLVGANESSNGNGVLRVKAHHIELSKEQVELLNNHPRRQSLLERIRAQLADVADGQSSSIPLTPSSWLLAANITIGTPPQNLQVAFDTHLQDLFVFDAAATLYNPWNDTVTPSNVTRYDASASSTYSADSRNFSIWHKVNGTLASDLVNLGGLKANLTFGDITLLPPSVNSLPVDGYFGLSLQPSSNNVSNVLTQLIPNLDKPIVAMYTNTSTLYVYNGSAEIVFGTDQLESCVNNWQYTPYSNITANGDLGFRLSGVSIDSTDTCKVSTAKINSSLLIVPYYTISIVTSYQILDLFVQASGAHYNNSDDWDNAYVLPCDQAANAGNVTLTLGDGTSKLVLTAADYIGYNEWDDRCELLVVGYYDGNNPYYNGYVTYLGLQFLRNHCVAYNIRDQLIGFSDALGYRPISV